MTRPTILVPVDGSERSLAAVPYAAALARAYHSGIELFAVVQKFGPDEPAKHLEGLVSDQLTSQLRGVSQPLHASGLSVEVVVRHGDPADAILAHVELQRMTRAIVMTTRGLGGVGRWLIGSVANRVMRLAPCPTLLVRPDALPPGGVWRPRRLLVPLDGSPLAEEALPAAYELAAMFGAEVILARVQPWIALQLVDYGGYVPDFGAMDEDAARAAKVYLDVTRANAPAAVSVRTSVLRGGPAERLLELAETELIDLIVMTSHARSGLGRMLLGSVADRIIGHGPPALVIHPVPAEPAAAHEVHRAIPALH